MKPTHTAINYSDFIVFADESGDHGLDKIDPKFPVFALVFCLISVSDYIKKVVPELQRFKFKTWGHSEIVLHERDIRKTKPPFDILRNQELRARFYEDLSALMTGIPMRIYAAVINKNGLRKRYGSPWNPYEIALLFCMERLLKTLLEEKQEGKLLHVLFEARGKREDEELKLEFRRICDNKGNWGYKQPDFTPITFKPMFVKKATNSTGLQLADLIARPIAKSALHPKQTNRAYEIIRPKLEGYKCFP